MTFTRGDFNELTAGEMEILLRQDIGQIDTEGEYGYFFSHIDALPISPEIAKKTGSFPLCISKLDIKESDISPFPKNLLHRDGLKLPKPNKKLVAHHNG